MTLKTSKRTLREGVGPFASTIGYKDGQLSLQLLHRIAGNGYAGLDPSTINFNPRVLRAYDAFTGVPVLGRPMQAALVRTVALMGHRLHRALRPEERVFAKGLGLVSAALAHLAGSAQYANEPRLFEMRNVVWGMLSAKRLSCGAWAHDYPYRIKGIAITPETPNLVTTAFAAEGYYAWATQHSSTVARDRYIEIVDDALQVFPQRRLQNGVCFMYTPITEYCVHNANLLMGEMLAKRDHLEGTRRNEDLLNDVVGYTVNHIRSVGGAPYAGPPTENLHADNYHTGYLIRSLGAIQTLAPAVGLTHQLYALIKDLLQFYCGEFIGRRVLRDRSGVMDAHSLAEAVLLAKLFGHIMSETDRTALISAIRNTMAVLWDRAGFFVNAVRPTLLGFRVVDRSEMPRWSQAWMAFALAVNN